MAPNTAAVVRALAACVLLLSAAGEHGPVMRAAAQGGGVCAPQLNRLLACRAYVVPGAADPSPECCSALSTVSADCACSTMGIINSLPSRCNLARVDCSA